MKKSAILTLVVIIILSFCPDAKAIKNELWILTSASCGIVNASTQVDEDVFIIRVSFDEKPEHDEFFIRKTPLEIGKFVRIKHVYAGRVDLVILEKCEAGDAK